jgi:hypothetical protein
MMMDRSKKNKGMTSLMTGLRHSLIRVFFFRVGVSRTPAKNAILVAHLNLLLQQGNHMDGGWIYARQESVTVHQLSVTGERRADPRVFLLFMSHHTYTILDFR